ncbi:hypothetical protein QJS04_geneDACA004608 [Acorus gramineus]|uniref:cysteine--tRNA ligase n=1 Tax=Acorus gramineus TaxID=55184 RepID=A0AAV9BUI7_ACOGR|nr:hypothetical protein QJS04_geneDACA004608 [Acorus gramineus]
MEKEPAMEKPQLQIYNTMTKQKEVFVPKVPGKVGMYVCGVTAYDLSHIGHARAYVAFDILYRYLNYLGYEVTYVRNFTDVDDKIIRRANELKEDPISLSGRYCKEFFKDMTDLQCSPPTHEPRVSDHMNQIIDMISKIIDNGCAYDVNGDVFFSVDKSPNYGRLSGRQLSDNRAGERVDIDPRKRNPADFALWKSAKPGEPFWKSPWGDGRPGWHIECSAMSAHYLGHSFDIHGGGMDLIFPHHENEIAQSCAACEESNVSCWIHNGFVNANNEKMSKSLGNFFTIRQITSLYHPLALRIFLMRTHYRSPVNYSTKDLEVASQRLFYMYQTLHDCEVALSPFREASLEVKIPAGVQELIKKFHSKFETSMSDDLHTNTVMDDFLELLKSINSNLSKFKKQQQKPMICALTLLEKEVKDVMSIMGLLSSSTLSEVLQQLKDKALTRSGLTEEQVMQRIEERTIARKNKDYATSDRIREELEAVGLSLLDEPSGTTWIPKSNTG